MFLQYRYKMPKMHLQAFIVKCVHVCLNTFQWLLFIG